MGLLHNMAILLTIAVAATILKSTEAAEYTVGDSTGWINSPSGGASFYSNWASNITFREGDILVFRFTASHTVAELKDKASFDGCNVNETNEVITTSPARITLNRTGEFYFACTVQGHCNSGQKLSVNVTGGTPSSSPSPAPSPSQASPPSGTTQETPPPQSTPTEPGSTTPPPPSPGSASTHVATFSLLIITLLVNTFF
ncbi:cucumber peeling cupredoxin [Cajanus cajan]|uniref:Cucumber peeling cupredoxin n=1 Tax=Cajanus cajan TaxID=3821 RepID=A0A151T3Z0_CAJCA|nr:cucumber peeling cupredoxin [Cajanus cajan]KYP61731.1 Cucumber peeling cupredoxin [Cajanus cajan]